MQYLTRVILSNLLPRSAMESPRFKVALALLVAAAILLGVILLRVSRPSSSVYDELGLSPLCATDARGDRWTLEPAVGQPFARLRESQAEFGPPLAVRPDVRRQSADEVSIGLTIEGRAGERYNPDIRRNDTQLPAPEFTIVNEAGNTLFKGKFEYG